MMRESINKDARFVMAGLAPSENKLFLRYRKNPTIAVKESSQKGVEADSVWLLLKRQGDEFSYFTSTDSNNWSLVAKTTIRNMGPTVYLGLAVAAENESRARAIFEEVHLFTNPDMDNPENQANSEPSRSIHGSH